MPLIFLFVVVVLKLLKMAKGIQALLDTVLQALPQVGNLVNITDRLESIEDV